MSLRILPNFFKVFGLMSLNKTWYNRNYYFLRSFLTFCNISSFTRFGRPFFWPIKENNFFFFPCVYCYSFKTKLCVNFWKAINYCFSSMSCGTTSNLLPYFQWNVLIADFSNMYLYFLFYKLSVCFAYDAWYRLNEIRSLWLIFLDTCF